MAPERGSLSIEGLAARPDGTSLLVALRNPLRDGRAVVIPLENPLAAVEGREEPRLGTPEFLALGGRGIRSIEYSPARGEYIIVAGPAGGSAPAASGQARFDLYMWTSRPGDGPVELAGAADVLRDLDDGRFQPEALIIEPSGARVQLLSDDGDRPLVGDTTCGQLPDKNAQRFRSVILRLE